MESDTQHFSMATQVILQRLFSPRDAEESKSRGLIDDIKYRRIKGRLSELML